MGISSKNGKITITDNDNIVLSKLNRQFLFNKNDVKENNSKSYCALYNKIFFDSGTEGTRAHSDIYYPNKSICLNDSFFPVKKAIPMCTLKDFPTKIEHCIEFSKIIFTELFNQYIKDIKLTIEDNEQFFYILEQINNIEELNLIIEIYKNIIYMIDNPSKNLIIKYILFIFKYYLNIILINL
jgi:hypothetical protein